MSEIVENASRAVSRSAGSRVATLAVVPAYNEERTVVAVLDALYGAVDELVIVDDGSTDGTRPAVQGWLPQRDHARLLSFDINRGMSAAYYLAFTHVAARVRAGQLGEDALVCTVDADGQHDVSALNELLRITRDEHLDVLLARRDLSTYPWHKRAGNWLLSRWATWWARSPLLDVESGYRIFRAGVLADALQYYRGYRYSETVEVAVIACRLGYRVRNDVLTPVPLYRSRTRLRDAMIDLAMIVVATRRAARRTPIGPPRRWWRREDRGQP